MAQLNLGVSVYIWAIYMLYMCVKAKYMLGLLI